MTLQANHHYQKICLFGRRLAKRRQRIKIHFSVSPVYPSISQIPIKIFVVSMKHVHILFFSVALNLAKTVHLLSWDFFFFNFWKCLQWLCDCTISICWKLALKVSFDCAKTITKAQKLYPETVLVGLDRSVCGFRQHFPLDMKYYLGPSWIYWVQTTLNLYSFASTDKHLPGTGQRTYKSVSYLQT